MVIILAETEDAALKVPDPVLLRDGVKSEKVAPADNAVQAVEIEFVTKFLEASVKTGRDAVN
jgi:hypothetical protein